MQDRAGGCFEDQPLPKLTPIHIRRLWVERHQALERVSQALPPGALDTLRQAIGSAHKTVKRECIRPKVPLNLEDARRIVAEFVRVYNTQHLRSGIGYITPHDRLQGREHMIQNERQLKLAEARRTRRLAHPDAVSGKLAAQSEPAAVEAATTASVAALC